MGPGQGLRRVTTLIPLSVTSRFRLELRQPTSLHWASERTREHVFFIGAALSHVRSLTAQSACALSLPLSVEASLAGNDSTIVSIFVNPAQFAPHEDLATYPRTLEADIAKLAAVSSNNRRVSALFLPPVSALYPSGITTEVSKQRGAFVEVKGLQEVMEGVSRPAFFRGVATVVIKLFNIVQV